MRIIKVKNYDEVSVKTANLILGQVNLKPDAVLGLATGGSPVGAYKKIVEAYNNGEVDFSGVTTINLDEYRGIKRSHAQSYWSFMHENLFQYINVKEDHIFIPDGENPDSEEVCKAYDKVIEAAGGIDMQLLGIGLDGHIGFNEPADHFEKNTHCVELTESTIEANKRFFESKDEVPRQAYTMGILPIVQAKKVIMIANGKNKADIIKKAFTGPVTPEVPASILQMHPDFTLIADEEALTEI
jgi:glucosamine-6-phosphate deaminase